MFVSFTFAKIHIVFETTKQNCNYYKVILRTAFVNHINQLSADTIFAFLTLNTPRSAH